MATNISFPKLPPKLIIGVIIGFIILWIGGSAFETVDAGEVKVVKRFGEVTGRVLHPGAHFITPIVENTTRLTTRKTIYETTLRDKQRLSDADYKDDPVDTNTSDGQQVDIFYTVRFSIDPAKATWVVQNIGSEDALVQKVVKTESRIWARNIPREFEAEDLYTGNGVQEVQTKIEDKLRPVFSDNGILLDSVGVREIKFSQDYIDAIEAKQIEAVKIETEKNIAEQEKFKKEQRITRAEGQAREQELQRQTISNELLQKMWIEKWNGQLPTYMTGENADMLIQLP